MNNIAIKTTKISTNIEHLKVLEEKNSLCLKYVFCFLFST